MQTLSNHRPYQELPEIPSLSWDVVIGLIFMVIVSLLFFHQLLFYRLDFPGFEPLKNGIIIYVFFQVLFFIQHYVFKNHPFGCV